jgi:hypothetical protein
MFTLLRSPLLVAGGSLCLAVLLLAGLMALGGSGGGAVGLLAVVLVVTLAALLTSLLHSGLTRSSEMSRHQDSRHRFLCSECLHFSGYHFACGRCGEEVEEFLVYTGGAYVNNCGHCHAPLFRQGGVEGKGIRACCWECGATADAYVCHERQVRVLAVPSGEDLARFCEAAAGEEWTQREGYACADDGQRLAYVLNLSALPDGTIPLPLTHAVHSVEAIWIGGSAFNLPTLGQLLDRFIRHSRLADEQGQRLKVKVSASLAGPTAEVRAAVESRFERVWWGVPAQEVLWVPGRWREPEERKVQVLAALTGADYERLARVTDTWGRRILGMRASFRSERGYLTHVLDLEHPGGQSGEPLPLETVARLEAVWTEGAELDDAALKETMARFFQQGALSEEQRKEVLVCVGQPALGLLVRSVLEAGFGAVRVAIPPSDFLRRGRDARGLRATAPERIRAVATVLPEDFETLWAAMERPNRLRLGGGWFVEETDTRITYLLNLADRRSLPAAFSTTPSMEEVEALWIEGKELDPLELGQALDDLIRRAQFSESHRSGVTVCLSHADPEPALRNVVEARFPCVRYGVGAKDFLRQGGAGRAVSAVRAMASRG